MTAQEVLLASLDHRRLLERSGLHFTEPMVKILNGFTEHLSVKLQAEEVSGGEPFTADMIGDTT